MALLVLLFLASAALATTPTESANEFAAPPPDAVTTASGLVSKVLQKGTGELHPDNNDVVAAHVIARTPDGRIFRNTYDEGKPSTFNLSRTFPGWREGLQLMVVGEKRRLWIPAHLAPQNPKGGPPGAAVFDVELTGVFDLPELPAGLESPPADAERTPSGASTKMISPGQGDVRPTLAHSALVNYTAWTPEGRVFDTTLERGRPTMIPLEKVMSPLADCLQRMTVGEKRFCWIPGNLAAGQWPGAPPGMLIFEIELLQMAETAAILKQVSPPKPSGSP